MDWPEFLAWTEALTAAGRLTFDQMEDVRAQRTLFDRDRALLEAELPGAVVGYVAEERMVSGTFTELLERAEAIHGGRRQLYFEQVPERVKSGRSLVAVEKGSPVALRTESWIAREIALQQRVLAPRRILIALGLLGIGLGAILVLFTGAAKWIQVGGVLLGVGVAIWGFVRRARSRRRGLDREKERERSR